MPKSRAQSLYEVGVEAFEENLGVNDNWTCMLKAVAAMLAEATKPRKANKPNYEDRQFGELVYKQLVSHLNPGVMVLEPVNKATFSQLGKKLRFADVTEDDIKLLVRWLNGGGLEWMTDPPTWGQFCKYALDWIGRARRVDSFKPKQSSEALEKLRDAGGI